MLSGSNELHSTMIWSFLVTDNASEPRPEGRDTAVGFAAFTCGMAQTFRLRL
jgi:hypothetical protein